MINKYDLSPTVVNSNGLGMTHKVCIYAKIRYLILQNNLFYRCLMRELWKKNAGWF